MDVPASEIQFVEKYHFHYLTPEGKGMAKAYPPPYITPKEITVMKNETTKITWFPLHPYHPDETLTSPAVPVEALEKSAETPLSATTDG